MKNIIYTVFFIFFCHSWLNAQTLVLNMSKNPPPAALDWLKNPQPIQLIVTSPVNFGQAKIKAVVTKGGRTVITTKLQSTLPIIIRQGTKIYYGTDFWNQNSFNIVASEANITSGKLKPGDYQICVSLVNPINGAVINNATACANFQVTEFQEPTLFYPENGTVIPEDKAFGMAFRWSAVTPRYLGMVKYRFQMFEIPPPMTALQAVNLSPIEQQDIPNSTQFLWTSASYKIAQAKLSGRTRYRYAWRVQALDAMTNQPIGKNRGATLGFSEIREFSIVPRGIMASTSMRPFQEPFLLLPNDRAGVTAEQARQGITFQWKSVTPQYNGPIKYRLQVFEGTSTKTPVFQEDITDATQFNWKKEKANFSPALTYYTWRVQAIDARTNKPIGSKNGQDLGYSDSRTFNLGPTEFQEPQLILPAKNTVVAAGSAKEGINFQWSNVTPSFDGSITYRLQVFKLATGKSAADAVRTSPILQQEISNNTQTTWRYDLKAAKESFAWRIQAVALDGTTLREMPIGSKSGTSKGFSEIGEFTIEQEMQEPTLASPSDKMLLKNNEVLDGITFTWNDIKPQYEGNVEYNLYIYEVPAGKSIADVLKTAPTEQKTIQRSRSYKWIKNITQETQYAWRVQAIDAFSREPIGKKTGQDKGFSETREFTVTKIGEYKEPTLAFPAQKAKVSSAELTQGLTFKWNAVTPQYPNEVKYRFILMPAITRTQGAPITIDVNNKTAYTLTADKLKEGTYTWYIQAFDAKTNAAIGVLKNESKGKSDTWEFAVTKTVANNAPSVAQTPTQPTVKSYTEPSLTEPTDKKSVAAKDAKTGLVFKWTGVTPKYEANVKYLFKVYEIAEGKTAADALKTTPILDKIVKQTSDYTWRRDDVNTNSKQFVWRVQAVDDKTDKPIGKKSGNDLGFSETWTFTIEGQQIEEPTLTFPSNKGKIPPSDLKQGLTLKWTAVDPLPQGAVKYRLKIFEIPKDKTAADALKGTPSVNEALNGKTEYTWKKDLNTEAQFVWQVQAVDNNNIAIGKKTGDKKGFSDNGEFSLDIKVKDDSLSLTDCDGKKKTISNKGLNKSAAAGDFKNKFVKINQFSMLIKNATGSATALKGDGSIVVSWLKTPIAVEFDGITVDDKTMSVTKGDVFAMQDKDADDLPKFLKKSEGKKMTKANAKSLNTKLKANKDTKLVKDQNLDDKLKDLATDKTPKLPLGINDVLGYTIAISEMKFTPTTNTLVGIAILPYNKDDEGEDVIAFAASDVVFDASSPSKSGGKMTLLEDFNIVNPSDNSYGVTLIAGKNDKPSTYIQWGCKGFEMMKASVDVAFPREWMTPVKEKGEVKDDEKVIANATADITNLKDWMLSLSLSPCSIQGLDDVELSVKELIFDNSDTKNAEGIKFPSGYVGTTKADFRGFYLKKAELTLPKFYNKSTDTTGIAVEIDKFIITKQGVSGNVVVGSKDNPIINLESGTVGDFKASVESFELDILNKSIKKSEVKGRMVLPISRSDSKKPNALTYTATWSTATKKEGSKIQLVVSADGKLNTDIIDGAELTLKKTSNITMTYAKGKTKAEKGKITADVNLDGDMSIEKKVADRIPVNLTMKFEKLGFAYDNSAKKKFSFKKGTFSFASPQKKMGGFPVTFNNVEMGDDANPEQGYEASASLKFDVSLNLDDKISGKAGLAIQGGIKKDKNIYTPSVIGAKISDIELAAKLSAVDLNGKIAFYYDDPSYGDGFKGEVKANFTKVGELTAAVQFGNVKPQNATESFRYWYAEGKLMLRKGIPIIGPLGLKGAGVGAWYHMTASKMPELDAGAVADASDKKETKSGATFTPDVKTLLGFKFTGILTNTSSDKTFNGDVTLSAEFNTSGGINYLQLDGAGYIGAGLKERSKAPIKGTLVAKYDFTKELFDLNVAVKIKHPTTDPVMLETIQDATLSLNVDSKNKIGNEPKWSLTVGTPAAPNRLNYYSIPTWAYFRAGNNLVVNNSFQPATIAGLKGVDPAFSAVPEPLGDEATGGKGFDFGIGFNKSGSTSVGPFSGGYSVGAELNLSMAQYDASNGCVTDKFNYWYARGGVAAWAAANIGFRGLITASMKAAAMMQAGAPEPLWIKGRVAGYISVKILFIKLNFNASVPFKYGEPCKPKKVLALADSDSENITDDLDMDGLIETEDMAIHKSGAIDRISPIIIASYFDLDKEFELESVVNGAVVKKTYKVEVEWYLYDTQNIASSFQKSWWSSGKQVYNMMKVGDSYQIATGWDKGYPRNMNFAYHRWYQSYVVGTLKVKEGNNWVTAKNKNGENITKKTKIVEFLTHSK